MRSAIVVAALVALAGGLAACAGDLGSGAQPTVIQPSAPSGTPPTGAPGTEPAVVPGPTAPTGAPVPTGLPSRDDAT
ncbi:hypothetical protein ACFWPJ_33680, partial [Nocardia sp. NPDC058497]